MYIYIYICSRLSRNDATNHNESPFANTFTSTFTNTENDGGAERRYRNVARLVFTNTIMKICTNTFTKRVTMVFVQVFVEVFLLYIYFSDS